MKKFCNVCGKELIQITVLDDQQEFTHFIYIHPNGGHKYVVDIQKTRTIKRNKRINQ
jgi:hypothetical protein